MNKEHFKKFRDNFYGYGNWETKDWFLGIEEGGGTKLSDVEQKIGQFYYWGNIQEGLVDNFEFQSLLTDIKLQGILDYNNPSGPKAQSTWIHPLKALLFSKKKKWPILSLAKMAQVESLGRQANFNHINSTWIELLPLPNPGTSQDKYEERWPEWTKSFNDELKMPRKRDDYAKKILPKRLDYIFKKINNYMPHNIVVYTGINSYYTTEFKKKIAKTGSWKKITVKSKSGKNFYFYYRDINWSRDNKTRVFITGHPIRSNYGNYWLEIGKRFL